jgi:small acid-soluble spore protein D (minor alpha/beta-type SASP)
MAGGNDTLSGRDLDRLKYEVADEIGYFPQRMNRAAPRSDREFREAIDSYKYEVAEDLGIPLSRGYNGDMPAREAGRIGGHIGGRLGGQMVRRMIQYAEEQMARGRRP